MSPHYVSSVSDLYGYSVPYLITVILYLVTLNQIITMLLLIVDDDDDDRGLFCEAILRIDPSIKCLIATDGKEAYDLLTTTLTVLPDIIFMDVNMPVMDGKTCLTLLKGNEDLRDIPVVMWSTTLDQNEISQLEQLGADFLGKPYNFDDLVTTLSGALSARGL